MIYVLGLAIVAWVMLMAAMEIGDWNEDDPL